MTLPFEDQLRARLRGLGAEAPLPSGWPPLDGMPPPESNWERHGRRSLRRPVRTALTLAAALTILVATALFIRSRTGTPSSARWQDRLGTFSPHKPVLTGGDLGSVLDVANRQGIRRPDGIDFALVRATAPVLRIAASQGYDWGRWPFSIPPLVVVAAVHGPLMLDALGRTCAGDEWAATCSRVSHARTTLTVLVYASGEGASPDELNTRGPAKVPLDPVDFGTVGHWTPAPWIEWGPEPRLSYAELSDLSHEPNDHRERIDSIDYVRAPDQRLALPESEGPYDHERFGPSQGSGRWTVALVADVHGSIRIGGKGPARHVVRYLILERLEKASRTTFGVYSIGTRTGMGDVPLEVLGKVAHIQPASP